MRFRKGDSEGEHVDLLKVTYACLEAMRTELDDAMKTATIISALRHRSKMESLFTSSNTMTEGYVKWHHILSLLIEENKPLKR